jgi:putative effector of murein hydrolase
MWKGRTARQLVSVSIWCLLDVAFRRLFNVYNLSFPSSLAGCGAVVATLLLLPQKWSDAIVERRLEPGATVLAQYLPVFFVPSLISLPLADGLGSAAEMAKVAAVVLGGFLFTLWTTATSVLGVRTLVRNMWKKDDDNDNEPVNESTAASASARFIASSDGQVAEDPLQAMSAKAVQYAEKNRQRPVVFSRRWQRKLVVLTAASTALAAASARWIPLHSTERAIRTTLCGISLLSATIAGFVSSSRLPTKVTRRIHPLIFTTTGVWMVAALLAQVGSGPTSFRSVLKYCYRGTTSAPSALAAGPVLLYLLGPAVVSLSVSMYRRQQLVKDNVIEVVTAIGVSTLGGLLGTALAVRVLNVANPFLRLSLLSRNITSPLAMAIAGILGADASLAVTMVVVTGLLGANFGPSLLDKWNIKDPVARGLAMGAASHGLGTAALSAAGPDEASAFPFAAIGMALCACASTVAVSVPCIRQLLLQVALGG